MLEFSLECCHESLRSEWIARPLLPVFVAGDEVRAVDGRGLGSPLTLFVTSKPEPTKR